MILVMRLTLFPNLYLRFFPAIEQMIETYSLQ